MTEGTFRMTGGVITGCSAAETGGSAAFSDFIYTKKEEKEQTI